MELSDGFACCFFFPIALSWRLLGCTFKYVEDITNYVNLEMSKPVSHVFCQCHFPFDFWSLANPEAKTAALHVCRLADAPSAAFSIPLHLIY